MPQVFRKGGGGDLLYRQFIFLCKQLNDLVKYWIIKLGGLFRQLIFCFLSNNMFWVLIG